MSAAWLYTEYGSGVEPRRKSVESRSGQLQEELARHARAQAWTTIDEARQAVWDLCTSRVRLLELSTLGQAIATQTTMEFGVAVRCVVEGEASGVPGALSRELLRWCARRSNSTLHENAEQIDIQIRYELEAKALP